MPDMTSRRSTSVGIYVDYESPLARKVAGAVWSGMSRAALDLGRSSITASWESITQETARTPETDIQLFALGQDRPDVIDEVLSLVRSPEKEDHPPCLYGLVVAAPESPNPLVGPLLYQGVERLKDRGVRTGLVEPAVLRPVAGECDNYARNILKRFVAREKATKDRR